mmetsp:Transcript_19702/g.53082  ORF Transcript_19702/g.53082 Transcript_19702/m.53082 type:complete len:201 (-) Transcript_19702:87-689(-)
MLQPGSPRSLLMRAERRGDGMAEERGGSSRRWLYIAIPPLAESLSQGLGSSSHVTLRDMLPHHTIELETVPHHHQQHSSHHLGLVAHSGMSAKPGWVPTYLVATTTTTTTSTTTTTTATTSTTTTTTLATTTATTRTTTSDYASVETLCKKRSLVCKPDEQCFCKTGAEWSCECMDGKSFVEHFRHANQVDLEVGSEGPG